ncbi:hypothetical protein ACHAWO_010998 [Cyclotella atomus]|uniref:Uncharacterized protein n=1 Tax=Cyclotella atomus TaxID=382360 RepID=A0ABD3NBB4_9STRA
MADQYTTPPITSCPPISHLQTYGMCCPFIFTEEENDARTCINNLQRYPITWYRQTSLGEAASGLTKEAVNGAECVGIDRAASQRAVTGASSFIDGMLGHVDKLLGTSTKNVDQANVPLTIVGVKAELSIVDTEEYGPAVLVQQLCDNDSNRQTQQQSLHDNGRDKQQNDLPSKLIPLSKIATISPGYSLFNDPTAGGIKLYGRATSILSSGEELLRFDTLGGEGGNILDGVKDSLFPVKTKPNEYVDAIIEQLNNLVKWNRRRIAQDVKKGRVGVVESKNGVVTEL